MKMIHEFKRLRAEIATALFGTFLLNDYRGSQKDLKRNMTDERISPAFIFKIRDFYYRLEIDFLGRTNKCFGLRFDCPVVLTSSSLPFKSERLYLLHLLKTLLTNEGHEYEAEYESCLENIGLDALAHKLKENLEAVTRAKAPTRETNGVLVTGQQVRALSYGTSRLSQN